MRLLNLSLIICVFFILASCSAVNDLGNKTLSSDKIPIVDITFPYDNYFADGNININAEITGVADSDLDRIEFYISGVNVLTKRDYPYKCNWNTTVCPEGPNEICVKAYNKRGGFGEKRINVNVSRGIYVSAYGDDSNDGTFSFPYRTIQPAINKAARTGRNTIYVTVGNFYTNLYPMVFITNNNIRLIGGYSMDFTQKEGYSVLNQEFSGVSGVKIIRADNVTNLNIDGFLVENGNWDLSDESLFSFYKVNFSILTNIKFIYNWAASIIVFESCKSNSLYMSFISNRVTGPGPGPTGMRGASSIYLNHSSGFNNLSCIFKNETYEQGSALSIGGDSNNIKCSIENCEADYYGELYIEGNGNNISAMIINNSFLGRNFGGITLQAADGTKFIDCVITNNRDTNKNASIYLYNINNYITTGIVISNCLIGGTNGSTGYAIYEDPCGTGDTTNHYLLNNTFLTNTMKYLYRDAGGKIVSNTGWTNINNTAFTGAASAAGNSVQ